MRFTDTLLTILIFFACSTTTAHAIMRPRVEITFQGGGKLQLQILSPTRSRPGELVQLSRKQLGGPGKRSTVSWQRPPSQIYFVDSLSDGMSLRYRITAIISSRGGRRTLRSRSIFVRAPWRSNSTGSFDHTAPGQENSGEDGFTPRLAAPCSPQLISAVIRSINLERGIQGIEALGVNIALTSAAQDHSYWMAEKAQSLSHEGWTSRIPEIMQFQSIAQNIGVSFSSPEDMVTAWLQSESHRRNILNAQFTLIGVGCVRYHDHFWWSTNFARQKGTR